MVNVVVLSSRPNWEEVVKRPWELVSRVRINSLKQTKSDPEVHSKDVKVTRDSAPNNWACNGSSSQNHDFDWRGVLSCETEWRRVLVVNLVYRAVERAPMHSAMHPIMPRILKNEENGNMHQHLRSRWEGDSSGHAEVDGHWMEEPDLWELDGEVGEEDEFRAVPLLLYGGDFVGLDLVFVEVGDAVDDYPGEGTAEVDELVHDEGHDARGEDVVLHVCVPCLCMLLASVSLDRGGRNIRGGETNSPHALENIQHNAIVLVDVLVLIPVRARYGGIVAECRIPVHPLASAH